MIDSSPLYTYLEHMEYMEHMDNCEHEEYYF